MIAAKAVSFKVAASEEFKERQRRTVEGARILAERLTADDAREAGVNVLSGGTDVHLILVDLRDSELDGQQAEDRLHEVGITVNRNAVPNDPRPPMVTSGLRIGTPALATRGFTAEDFAEVADVIAEALQAGLRRRRPQGPGHRPGRQAPAVPRPEQVRPRLIGAPRTLAGERADTATPVHRARNPLGVPRGHLGLRPVLDRHRPVQLPHGRPDARGAHVRRAA